MKYIILEGIDKSGKSTLAKYLSENLKIPIIKFSAPKGDPYSEYLEFLQNNKKPAILDRFYLGELVYGPIMRGKSGLNKSHQMVLESMCYNLKTINIYTSNEKDIIAKRFIDENETFLKVEQIPEVLKKYEEVIDKSSLNWWRYTGNSKKDLESILKAINILV